nr:hypothetical protein [Tanacetum cinerariifolium]
MRNHQGVNSWFVELTNASHDFVSDERIVWVDLEGILFSAWSHETFMRICKKWGVSMDLNVSSDNSYGRKRVCIKTNHTVSILESFKIIVKGRVYWIRAKELFTWHPSFLVCSATDGSSDDESSTQNRNGNVKSSDQNIAEDDDDYGSEDEVVSETVFGANTSSGKQGNDVNERVHLEDIFGFYDLLQKDNSKPVFQMESPSLPYPPGFTPDGSANKEESSPVFAGEVHVDKPSTVSPSPDVVIPEESHTNQDASPKQHTARGVVIPRVRVLRFWT